LRVRGEIAANQRRADRAVAALDGIGNAIIVVRSNGYVEKANCAADFVLRRGDGLLVRDGRLAAIAYDAARALAAQIAKATAACDPRAAAIRIKRKNDLPPYYLTIMPLTGRLKAPAAMILFCDPDTEDRTITDRVRALFGLTAAETSIALALSKGLMPPAIAENRGVRANTIKTQLRSLAAKMGCTRISEIAAMIASLPLIRG